MSEKFLRLQAVQGRVPYSRSTIYQKISRGEFPAPIDLGARAVAWLESDIDEWIAARIGKGRTMRWRGMTPDAIEAALVKENDARCKPPLDASEVRDIARSVARYEPAAPGMKPARGAGKSRAAVKK